MTTSRTCRMVMLAKMSYASNKVLFSPISYEQYDPQPHTFSGLRPRYFSVRCKLRARITQRKYLSHVESLPGFVVALESGRLSRFEDESQLVAELSRMRRNLGLLSGPVNTGLLIGPMQHSGTFLQLALQLSNVFFLLGLCF